MEKQYDVIVIGAGVAGGLIANELSKENKNVLILEAGETGPERVDLVGNYIRSSSRDLASPYFPPGTVNKAPSPNSPNDYYDQPNDPTSNSVFRSTYERRVGGSTWHWLGNCPRLLPNDFKSQTLYGFGRDWPITYDDLEPWYCKAEKELGVSGDHEELQGLFGAYRSEPFPMLKIWPSYSDLKITEALSGSKHLWPDYNDQDLVLMSTPQARNSHPYDGRPVCTGNSICVPICPIGAKYDAAVHIKKAQANGACLREKAIVTKLIADPDGRITGVVYKPWDGDEDITVTAKIYVLAANAIESPKILLMSGIANKSDQVGRNLMDHPQGEGLCIANAPLFPFRGPPTTSGIDKFRDGAFRKDFCAFRMSMGNDGGGRSQSPKNVLSNLVQDAFGTDLRTQLRDTVTHQFRISFLSEMRPSPDNRVTLSPVTDFGVPRPKINFKVDDYTMNGFNKIAEVMTSILTAIGSKPGTIKVPDSTTPFMPAGHIMGTCRMGNNAGDAVVDRDCRSFENKNLFVAGASVFPTGGTANPTLTLSALSLRIADTILKELKPLTLLEKQL